MLRAAAPSFGVVVEGFLWRLSWNFPLGAFPLLNNSMILTSSLGRLMRRDPGRPVTDNSPISRTLLHRSIGYILIDVDRNYLRWPRSPSGPLDLLVEEWIIDCNDLMHRSPLWRLMLWGLPASFTSGTGRWLLFLGCTRGTEHFADGMQGRDGKHVPSSDLSATFAADQGRHPRRSESHGSPHRWVHS